MRQIKLFKKMTKERFEELYKEFKKAEKADKIEHAVNRLSGKFHFENENVRNFFGHMNFSEMKDFEELFEERENGRDGREN